MKKFFIYTIIVISFVSCDNLQTVIDVDLPPHEPKLVPPKHPCQPMILFF